MVISDDTADSTVLIVNITSVHDYDVDMACLIAAGEHPFVEHPSRINYRGARFPLRVHLDLLETNGAAVPQGPAEPTLLERIRQGVLASVFSPPLARTVMLAEGVEPPPQ